MSSRTSRWGWIGLGLRSLFWVAVMPGLFAGYVPWRFFGVGQVRPTVTNPAHLVGLAALGLGVVLLGACIWQFASTGRGTLSPADPPTTLVVRGLYRYVRNPMYLCVSAIVLGEVLLAGSGALFMYWAVWFLAANLFVRGYEEPVLRRQFGPAYEEYMRRVPRWFPRLGPRRSLRAE